MHIELNCNAASLALALVLTASVAPMLQAQPPLAAAGCTQSASLEFGLSSNTPVAVVAFPVNVTANTPTLVIQNVGPENCTGARRTAEKNWKWRMDVPAGSNAQLANTTTLNVTFTPDKPGQYIVHLNGCGNQCTVNLITDFVNGKPFHEDVDIGDPERQIVFNVVERGQVPPRIIPPPGPSPAGQAATNPQHFDDSRSFCGSPTGIGLGLNPEWFTTTTWETAAPHLELLEGRVYDSFVSRIDTPFGHFENDADVKVEVDPWLRRLLMDDNATDKGTFGLPFGGIEVEWEWSQWLENFRPLTGDRISVLGFHVIDCGHSINTEIHPAMAVAVHRPLPVLLPPTTSLENGQPPVPIGSNIFVPGIITDVFVNLRGGKALDCAGDSLRQSKLVSVIVNGNPLKVPPCVPQPDRPGGPFTFNVYLPVNPQRIINSVTKNNPPVPALFTQIVDPPEVPAGARTDLQLRIVDTSHLDNDTPYITVSVDISQMRTGQKFAKRLISAWVYPDITGKNYGLTALRLRLNQFEVTDDGDTIGCGEWRFWVGYSNAVRPWTRLINNDCIEEKTYSSSASIFQPGALGASGLLKGEILEFQDFFPVSLGRLRLTGYEDDTFGSDDAGEVDTFIGSPRSFVLQSFCDDEAKGTIDPSNSGCAAYKAHMALERSQTPTTAVLSAQTKAFLNRLLVGKPSLADIEAVTDSELFAGKVTTRVAKRTSHNRVEPEPWQDAFKPGALTRAISESPDADAYVKTIRERVVKVLGPKPSAQRRNKIKADLEKVKPSIPPTLYQKYLCDLEIGQACPATP